MFKGCADWQIICSIGCYIGCYIGRVCGLCIGECHGNLLPQDGRLLNLMLLDDHYYIPDNAYATVRTALGGTNAGNVAREPELTRRTAMGMFPHSARPIPGRCGVLRSR